MKSGSFLTLGGGGNLNVLRILYYEYPHYIKELKRKKISGKIICSHENKNIWTKLLKDSNVEIRSLKGSGKDNSITIFRDKVLISSESEHEQVLLLNDLDQACSLRHYFHYLWQIAN